MHNKNYVNLDCLTQVGLSQSIKLFEDLSVALILINYQKSKHIKISEANLGIWGCTLIKTDKIK